MTAPGCAPLVHIGYHKTGSTLLQELLFTRNDLGFRRYTDDRKAIHSQFIQYGPFAKPQLAIIGAMRREVASAENDGLRLVISHERLSGYPASGGFDSKLIAERIMEFFPNAKILIIFREQRSMLLSYYLQYITDGGSLSAKRFFTSNDPGLMRKPEFRLDYFAYDQLIGYYQQVFGADNVLALPFEALRRTPRAVAQKIVQFAGNSNNNAIADSIFEQQVNTQNPFVMQWVARQLNGLFARSQLAPHAWFAVPHFARGFQHLRPVFAMTAFADGWLRRRLQKHIALTVGNYYAHSNVALQNMLSLDLGEYGYMNKTDRNDQDD